MVAAMEPELAVGGPQAGASTQAGNGGWAAGCVARVHAAGPQGEPDLQTQRLEFENPPQTPPREHQAGSGCESC